MCRRYGSFRNSASGQVERSEAFPPGSLLSSASAAREAAEEPGAYTLAAASSPVPYFRFAPVRRLEQAAKRRFAQEPAKKPGCALPWWSSESPAEDGSHGT